MKRAAETVVSDLSAQVTTLMTLHFSCSVGLLAAVTLVLSTSTARAAVNLHDTHGRTPIIHTILSRSTATSEILALLVENGGDVNIAGQGGLTPLMHAARLEYANIVSQLLTAGGSLAVNDDAGNTALHHACRSGDVRCVEALCDAGADITAGNKVCFRDSHIIEP